MFAISWKVPKIHGLSWDIFSYACPPSCCLECLFVIPPSYPSLLLPHPQATTDLLFVTKVGFPFLEFCINRIILCAPFSGESVYHFVLDIIILQFAHVASCISSLLLFIAELVFHMDLNFCFSWGPGIGWMDHMVGVCLTF